MKSLKTFFLAISVIFFLAIIEEGLFARPCINKPVPNSVEHARYNAECFAKAINEGKKIRINDTFYVTRSDILIHKDIVISGKGTIVLVDSEIFIISAPISIKITGIKITTTLNKTYNSQIRFIVSKSRLYHHEVRFEGCLIEGVRVYTHIADDVDQKIIKDGVKKFVFRGNSVYDSGFYIVRLGNCLCDDAIVEYNTFTRMQSNLFDFGLNNDYQDLDFCRFKRVYFNNNIVDNEGIPIDTRYDSLYCTPILAECDYAECKNNVFKSIISINEKPIALYAFYLSGNTVIISNNEIIDCINLGDSTYNAIFKCKANLNKDGVRYITNNKCIVTEECLERYSKEKSEVFTRLISLQSNSYESVVVLNNEINLACDFVFGSGTLAEYRFYKFENNSIKYHDIGPTARQLLRLLPATKGDNTIIVRNNVMCPEQPPASNHGLFAYDCTGYSITVSDNILYGYLPYGDNETEVYSLRAGISYNNKVILGPTPQRIRVSINKLNINDTLVSDYVYTIKLYSDSDIVTTTFSFEKQPPLCIISKTDEVYRTQPLFSGKKTITIYENKAVFE